VNFRIHEEPLLHHIEAGRAPVGFTLAGMAEVHLKRWFSTWDLTLAMT
jgi:hypothetical protein